jgi:hypothetical protein
MGFEASGEALVGDRTKAQSVYEDAVEYLCRNADELRARVAPAQWDAPFDIVQHADPTSAQWRDAVRDLHEATQTAGIPGGLGLHSTMGRGWPATSVARSTGWVCPTGRCARVDLRTDPAPPTPVCTLVNQPMRLVAG